LYLAIAAAPVKLCDGISIHSNAVFEADWTFSTTSTTGVLLRGPERSEGHVSSNDLVMRQFTMAEDQ
jgi:hypothetical protein